MAYNAATAYQETKIQTASPMELTLMLYDGAVKFSNIALIGMEQNDIPKISNNIIKAEKIILKLRETLDFKYPVAKEFDKVYEIIYDCLVQANIKKDKELLETGIRYIKEMRDTWKSVMSIARKGER